MLKNISVTLTKRGDLEGSATRRKAISDSCLDNIAPQVSFSFDPNSSLSPHPRVLPGLHSQPCQKYYRLATKGTGRSCKRNYTNLYSICFIVIERFAPYLSDNYEFPVCSNPWLKTPTLQFFCKLRYLCNSIHDLTSQSLSLNLHQTCDVTSRVLGHS